MKTEQARLYGFQIRDIFTPRYFKTLKVGADFPAIEHEVWLSDSTPLKVLATLVENDLIIHGLRSKILLLKPSQKIDHFPYVLVILHRIFSRNALTFLH